MSRVLLEKPRKFRLFAGTLLLAKHTYTVFYLG